MPTDLSDLAIVVRGGLMTDLFIVRKKLLDDYETLGRYALSVWAMDRRPGQTVDDTIAELARHARLRHPRLRTTSAGQLRARGFVLQQTGRQPTHYSVDLGSAEIAVIARFVKAFGSSRRNPRCED